jgi:hypothetical protein
MENKMRDTREAASSTRRKKTASIARRETKQVTAMQNVTCPSGLTFTRLFTKPGENVFAGVKYARRSCKITNPDGSVVFAMDGAEIPAEWSQLATDIMVSKYFRKAQVPQFAEGEARLFKYGSGTGTNFSQPPRRAGEALGRRARARA